MRSVLDVCWLVFASIFQRVIEYGMGTWNMKLTRNREVMQSSHMDCYFHLSLAAFGEGLLPHLKFCRSPMAVHSKKPSIVAGAGIALFLFIYLCARWQISEEF